MRLVLIVVALLLLAGCRPPDTEGTDSGGVASRDGVTVQLDVDGEATVGTAPITVTVTEAGEGISDATVEVIGEMTHAGMVPVNATAERVEPGVYRADDFEFTMAGDWILTAIVALPDDREISASRALSVER